MEHRIPTSSSLDDPQNENTSFNLFNVPQNNFNQASESPDIFYRLSESKPQCFQPCFGQLFYLRPSVEESQSLPIFSSGESFISGQSSSVFQSYEILRGLPFHKVQIISPILCNCRNSHCVKKYCQCFKAGRVCSKDTCGCTNCRNQTDSVILQSNQKKANEKENLQGSNCTCKKNQCEKGYCDCFGNGKGCSSECQCIGCKNSFGTYVPQAPTSERKLRHRNT